MLQAGANRHGMIFHQNTIVSLVLDLQNEKLAHLRTQGLQYLLYAIVSAVGKDPTYQHVRTCTYMYVQ